MNPILFSADETAFTSHGLGELVDAISCYVTHEINGEYELMMTYPMSGSHYDDIGNRTIVLASVDPVYDPEPFRVYRITKPLNGIVTVYARHICYDMSGIVKGPVTASSMQLALAALSTEPFELTTARSVAVPFVTKTPRNLWKLIGGEEGSLLDVYRGEWIFNKFTAENVASMGADYGVTVIYGKNLLDMTQEEEIDAMYSAVHPFWYNAEADLLVDGGEVEAGSIGYDRVFLYDCSDRWQEAPTVAQLQAAAQAYINDHDMTVPKVSLSLNWQMLADCVEYADQATLDRVSLGDTVHVSFERLGVNATARVRKIKWNVLLDRYDRVDIGSVKQNLAEILAAQEKKVEKKPSATAVDNAVARATQRITGANGGHVVQHFNANGEPTETLWMDTDSEATAVNVIRANYQGIGLSTHGVNGPYTIAMTAEGLVANIITTGVLNASLIKAGLLKSQDTDQSFYLDLTTGEAVLKKGRFVGEIETEKKYSASRYRKIKIADDEVYFLESADGEAWSTAFKISLSNFDNTLYVSAGTNKSQADVIFECPGSNDRIKIEPENGRIATEGWELDYQSLRFIGGNISNYVLPATGPATKVDTYRSGVLTLQSWSRVGCSVTIPAHSAFVLHAQNEWEDGGTDPAALGISESNTVSNNMRMIAAKQADMPRCSLTYAGFTGENAITLYTWGKAQSVGTLYYSIQGFYITEPYW